MAVKNVLFVSYHHCIRVIKEMVCLKERGMYIHSVCHTCASEESLRVPSSVALYQEPPQLRAKLQDLPPIPFDLVHVHNTPDWMAGLVRETLPDLPLVYDVHDLYSIGTMQPDSNEREAMQVADAYVFPFDLFRDTAADLHGPCVMSRPSAIIESRVPEELQIQRTLPRIGGIVYEGGLSSPGTVRMGKSAYRDYTGVCESLTRIGVPISMYGVGMDVMPEYLKAGAICHGPLPYHRLLSELSRYDWGFVGAPNPVCPEINLALPNKLFDYLAAGIPVIVFGANAAAEWVVRNDCGVVVKSVFDIPQILNQHELYRERVRARKWTMDTEIPKLLDLYERVAERRRQHG